MAIDVKSNIINAVITQASSYCYLYEPFLISILEDDEAATKMYIDIEVVKTDGGQLVDTLIKYAEFDINKLNRINVDLMKLARQYHDSDIFRISNITDIIESWSIVSQYKYNFHIYSNITTTKTIVSKLPIIGNRLFSEYTPLVDENVSLTEHDFLGGDDEFLNRWIGFPYVCVDLVDPTLTDASPIVTECVAEEPLTIDTTIKYISTEEETIDLISEKVASIQNIEGKACAGFVVWKSRRGGWQHCGFDIIKENFKHTYKGKLDVDMFEATKEVDGNPFVPVNYTSIETSNSVSLKILGLTASELKSVAGIKSSPAIYFMKDKTGNLELMRLTSATVPIGNLNNGGDFSISLSSISNNEQITR